MCQNLVNLFQRMREDSSEKFHSLYIEAEKLAENIGEEIPRLTQRQQSRENFECDSSENRYNYKLYFFHLQ